MRSLSVACVARSLGSLAPRRGDGSRREPNPGPDRKAWWFSLLKAGHDAALAPHHCSIARARHFRRIRLFAFLDTGRVLHVGAGDDLGIHRAGYQAGDRDRQILPLVMQRMAEAVEIGFGRVVDGIIRAGNETADRSGDQYPALFARPHLTADLVQHRGGLQDVEVDQPRPALASK